MESSKKESDLAAPGFEITSSGLDLSRLPNRGVLLATLALGVISGCESKNGGGVPSRVEAVLVESEKPVESLAVDLPVERVRDWRVNVQESGAVEITDQYGAALYGFIRGELQKQSAFPVNLSSENEGPIVMALVGVCKKLNPKLDLEDFSSIRNQKILFPTQFTVNYDASEVEKDENSLADIAKTDGFPIDKQDKRDEMFASALKEGKLLPHQGDGFFRPKGYEASPAYLVEDAYQDFEKAAGSFAFETVGGEDGAAWSFAYTHVLRSTSLQKDQTGSMENVHYMGRAVNVSDGRFTSPQGEEVTWAKDPEYRVVIENSLRPAVVDSFLGVGAAVYHNEKAGCYDVYFPTEHIVKLSF